MVCHMRTTVTLDDDVERLLREAVRRSGRPFKEVLNDVLRRNLAAPRRLPPFKVEAKPMQLRPGVDPISLNRLLEHVKHG